MSIAEKLNSPALYGICGAIAIGFAFLEYKKAGKKKEETEIHIGGGLRGSALSLVTQRWEAVFRRERMPASIDRTSRQPGSTG